MWPLVRQNPQLRKFIVFMHYSQKFSSITQSISKMKRECTPFETQEDQMDCTIQNSGPSPKKCFSELELCNSTAFRRKTTLLDQQSSRALWPHVKRRTKCDESLKWRAEKLHSFILWFPKSPGSKRPCLDYKEQNRKYSKHWWIMEPGKFYFAQISSKEQIPWPAMFLAMEDPESSRLFPYHKLLFKCTRNRANQCWSMTSKGCEEAFINW